MKGELGDGEVRGGGKQGEGSLGNINGRPGSRKEGETVCVKEWGREGGGKGNME